MAFLLPLSIANLRATYTDTLFAADASLDAAGGVAYRLRTGLVGELWRRIPLKLKGQRLLDHLSADLRASGFDVGGDYDESEEDGDDMEFDVTEGTPMESRDVGTTFWEFTLTDAQQGMDDQARADVEKRDLTCLGPSRCLFVLAFVVVEVCGGEGGITSRCLKRQIVCGPIIEIKNGWDLLDPILFLWLLRLSLAGRIWFMMLEPPCTTFSLARHPSLRNADVPEGHDSLDFKTNEGNLFGLTCGILCLAQWACGNEFMMEQPAYGHMRFTYWWLLVLHVCGDSIITPWCGYIRSGPVYVKPTVLMFPRRSAFWKTLYKPCSCTKPHVKLEGSLTTLAAAYPEGFCKSVSDIVEFRKPPGPGPWIELDEPVPPVPIPDPEYQRPRRARRAAVSSVHAIVLSQCIPWRPVLKQPFKHFGHINIREQRRFG